jgi:hypothetical protein
MSNNILSQEETAEIQKFKKTSKGIGAIIISRKMVDEEKRAKIYAAVKHAMNGDEGKLLLKVAMENSLVSKTQAEKCSRIYSNNIVMGTYKDIGSVILEKGFLLPEGFQALLRAVRRSTLTGKPAVGYINEMKTTEGK